MREKPLVSLFPVSIKGMKVRLVAFMAVLVCTNTVATQTLVACSCELANAVCLTDLEMSEHADRVEIKPDLMGNHSDHRVIAVFQIGFD
jgi:hypothetical protein